MEIILHRRGPRYDLDHARHFDFSNRSLGGSPACMYFSVFVYPLTSV